MCLKPSGFLCRDIAVMDTTTRLLWCLPLSYLSSLHLFNPVSLLPIPSPLLSLQARCDFCVEKAPSLYGTYMKFTSTSVGLHQGCVCGDCGELQTMALMTLYDMGVLVLEEIAWIYITGNDNTLYPGVTLLNKMNPPSLQVIIPVLIQHLYNNNPPRLILRDMCSFFDVCPTPIPNFNIAPLLPTFSTTPPLVNVERGNVQGTNGSPLRSFLCEDMRALWAERGVSPLPTQPDNDLDGVD